MARVKFITENETQGKAKEAYIDLESHGKLTNMKKALLQDYATYDAFMGWYTFGTDWLKSSASGPLPSMHIPFLQRIAASFALCSLSAI